MRIRKTSRARWSAIAGLLTVACLDGSMAAQGRPQHVGLPDDWSHRHLLFSNPGNYVQMLQPEVSDERLLNWLALQQDTRFKMQQVKLKRARAPESWDSAMVPVPDSGALHADTALVTDKAVAQELKAAEKAAETKPPAMQRDWNVKLGAPPPANMYPAKFGFDINGTPDCANDFVVFPIAPVGQQARLIAFKNLYRPGLCGSATAPDFKFSYIPGPGVVQTSPVLSLDGTKIAFVESRTGAPDLPNFHVLTIGTSGDNGTSTAGVVPGAGNNAVDRVVQMAGGNSVTRSSPFVIYDADVAFVGDDHGSIHKFNNVFNGIMTEQVDGIFPSSVGADTILTGPVFFRDRIFFGAANGKLYCMAATGGGCNPVSSLDLGPVPILDPPIVDGSTGRVFVATQDALGAILVQTTINLDPPIVVRMGNPTSVAFNIHNGAVDHRYLTGADPSAGFMYFCGVSIGNNEDGPTLFRVGFSAIGRVNDTRDPFSARLTNATGDDDECSPLTTIYNPNTPGGPTDLLFVTLAHNNHGCGVLNKNCVGSLDITSVFPPSDTGGRAIFRQAVALGGAGDGTSAIVVDNVADVVPTWLASAAYAVNALLIDSNTNVQQCTAAGTSGGGTHPTWGTAVGAVTTDAGTLRWTMRGPYRGSWQRSHAYSLNDVITDFTASPTDTSHLQRVTTAGTTAATPPAFNTATGGTTTNGTVTWTNLGPYTPSSVSSIYFSDVRAQLAYKFTQSELK